MAPMRPRRNRELGSRVAARAVKVSEADAMAHEPALPPEARALR
jgi:hypothetical protein